MQQAGLPFLSSWQNFYLLVGTAAATLTGLMFIVTTLIAGIDSHVATLDAAISAFNTPNLVHFGAVLLMAGILSAPWETYSSISLLLGLLGVAKVVYLITVLQRMRRVPDYQTPLRDWMWYGIMPLLANVILIAAAAWLPADPRLALYFISLVMVALLFIGIRNSWDLVVFLAVDRSHPESRDGD